MATARRLDEGTGATAHSLFADRAPPKNLDAERAVLGSLLLDPDLCDDVALILRSSDFFAPEHEKLFEHFLDIHNDGKRLEVTLLVERLRSGGLYESIGGAAYLAELSNSVATAASAVHYAQIVRDKAIARALIQAGTHIVRQSYDEALPPRELLSRAEEQIFRILDAKSSGEVTSINDVLQEAFDRLDARMNRDHAHSGIPSGFDDLDDLTGGLHDSELVILAGRPSMGKTALATNIVENVSIHDHVPTLFVSLEMSRLELADRMLASFARINGHRLRSGTISAADQSELVRSSAEISKAPLFIDDTPSRTITEIAAAARRLKRSAGLKLVVVDYLQLIEPDNPKDPRQEQVAKIARRLKGMARELKLPVLCLAQLNRQAETTKDNRPRLSHLRESGAIEQDADLVMFVHREEYYHTIEEAESLGLVGRAELIISKQRNGPVGELKLAWQKDFTRFESRAAEYLEDASFYNSF